MRPRQLNPSPMLNLITSSASAFFLLDVADEFEHTFIVQYLYAGQALSYSRH